MVNNTKYTFLEWQSGAVTLEYAYIEKDSDQPDPIIVQWSDFSEEDQLKIKEEQNRIFETKANCELENRKEIFTTKYNNSEHQIDALTNEIDQLYFLLFLEPTSLGFVDLVYWRKKYEVEYVLEMQEYMRRYKVQGFKLECDFICSENSPYAWKKDLYREVEFEGLHRYYKWLNGILNGGNNEIEFNFKHWSKKTYDLFIYFVEKFHVAKVKTKYIAIFFYLKELKKVGYSFSFSHAEWELFVCKNIDEKFLNTKINKPQNYHDQEESLKLLNDEFMETLQ